MGQPPAAEPPPQPFSPSHPGSSFAALGPGAFALRLPVCRCGGSLVGGISRSAATPLLLLFCPSVRLPPTDFAPAPAVSYIIYIGMSLLVLLAIALVILAFLLRRKDARRLAELQELREQQLAAAAARQANEQEAPPYVPRMTDIPVVIVQPDGQMILAEECAKKNGSDELEGGEASGRVKGGPELPIGTRLSE